MGASGWEYSVAYQADIATALRQLQEQVLRDDEFYWESEDDEFSDPDEPYPGPKPQTLEDLAELKRDEEFWEVGTHSILDLDRVIGPGEQDRDGTLRPADEAEVVAAFGSPHPTRARFEEISKRGTGDIPFARSWSGLYLVLHDERGPSEFAIWGFSGD